MEAKRSIEILAKSSSGDPYTVMFYIGEGSISASCSCPAGEYRKLCKHVLRMLDGDNSILFDIRQETSLGEVSLYLRKTELPVFLANLNESELLLREAQNNVRKAKKALEKVVLRK